MWLVLSELLLMALPVQAAPSTGVSPAALFVATFAAVFVAFAYRTHLKRLQEVATQPLPEVKSVLQRDDEKERLAEQREQQLPIGAVVNLKKASSGLQTGTVAGYAQGGYEVELGKETLTLASSELELPTISQLVVYPVKGCAGIELKHSTITAKGLLHDREWMIIDAERNKFVSQRRYPRMALLHPKLLPGVDSEDVRTLVLTAEGMPDLHVPVLRKGPTRVVTVWKDQLDAVDQGDAAAQWLDTYMGDAGKSFRLVKVRDGFKRHVKPKYAPGHATNFADAFPFLLALEESLADFNDKLEDKIPMNRFRPNIVLRGSPAWADEHWNCLTIGGIRFRNVRPCSRCGVPSVDQATGVVHPKREPSRAIVRERNGELLGFIDGKKGEGYFGSNMVVELRETDPTPPALSVSTSVKVLTLKKDIVA